ncbi:DivIVA domain-containing protein [Marmoricola sp. RAF53]|uniref:DivIVA domain-containing protein n=1 Tax=Marmoricola sp. RAF53 TaxID=3233059 RepID=UPI003F9D3583
MTDSFLDRIRDVQFTPVRVSEGYDMGQVDYLLDRLLAAAERGEALGPIIAESELREVRLREGYAIGEVDAFLAELRSVPVPQPAPEQPVTRAVAEPAPAFVPRPDLAQRVRSSRFTPVRIREGYSMGEVDKFLDLVEDALERGRDLGPLVGPVRFTPVRLREGYDMGDVDKFLEEMVEEQRRPVAVDPGVITEQRGLLARLFGRR